MSRRGCGFLDRTLYVPEPWATDTQRRTAAGVPTDIAFTTKPTLGRAMLARVLAAGVPCAWVTANSVDGSDSTLRRSLEAQSLADVLAVTSGQHFALDRVARGSRVLPHTGA